MNTTIQKWGNSYGVRIPREIIRKRTLSTGSRVEVTDTKDGIVVRILAQKEEKLSLAKLVRQIDDTNRHAEVLWGEAVGNEVW